MNLPLPPVRLRQGAGRQRFDNDWFLDAARDDAEFLMSIGLKPAMRLLDFGCGPGRVALGLIASGWSGSYVGVEVKASHVKWGTAEITPLFPEFRFIRVNVANARYNPDGSERRRLPVADGTVNLICAFSVFSHMLSDDTSAYLAEFRRALASGGWAYITAFFSDDVPDETENPPWLGDWSGRLHCVLYSTEHLENLIGEAGLVVAEIVHRGNRAQKGLILKSDHSVDR